MNAASRAENPWLIRSLDRETVAEIQQFFAATPEASAAQAKSHFGEKYSYGELSMVIRYVQYQKAL